MVVPFASLREDVNSAFEAIEDGAHHVHADCRGRKLR